MEMNDRVHSDYRTPKQRVMRSIEIAAGRYERGALDDPNDEALRIIRQNQALALRVLAEELEADWEHYMRPVKSITDPEASTDIGL